MYCLVVYAMNHDVLSEGILLVLEYDLNSVRMFLLAHHLIQVFTDYEVEKPSSVCK